MIGVLNYGAGNIGSILNMFAWLDLDARQVSEPEELETCDRLLLPGVGAFDHAVNNLQSRQLVGALGGFVKTGRPLLGICLGMQLLLDGSAEGALPGLGYIAGRCVRFPDSHEGVPLSVPHMGWNTLVQRSGSRSLESVRDDSRFYFVHSYYAETKSSDHNIAMTDHGVRFASMIERDNILGAQFHPEKSHRFGMELLADWGKR